MTQHTVREYSNPRTGSISWRVYARVGGKVTRKNFSSRMEAETFAFAENERTASEAEAAQGAGRRYAFTTLTDAEVSAVEAAKRRWEGRMTIEELLHCAERSAAVSPVARPVADLVEQWLAMIKGKVAASWGKDLRHRCRVFAKKNKGLMSSDLTRARVRTWLDGLKLSQVSKAHYRSALSRFFGWLVQTGVLADNPCEGITLDKPSLGTAREDKLPAILTPEQAAALLQASLKPIRHRSVGWLILCLFCGLRPEAEAARLRWSEINLETGELQVFGRKRGASVRIIKATPQALAWLSYVKGLHAKPVLSVTHIKHWSRDRQAKELARRTEYVAQYSRRQITMAVADANVELAKVGGKAIVWEGDILRHSFASYRAQVCKIDDLAREMGTSAEMLHRHYRHPVAAAQIAEFAKVLPGV